jgi:hypothetical protein
MKMIYQDPGPVPPAPPPNKAEEAEVMRLINEAHERGHELAEDLLTRARERFYTDPVFHARATTASQVAMVEFARHHSGELPPAPTLRMAAAVGLLLAEENTA